MNAARAACLAVLTTILLACPTLALSAESARLTSAPGTLASGQPLVVPGVDALEAGQQLAAAERSEQLNPGSVASREASRTRFEGLSAGQAQEVVDQAYPSVVEEPAGGAPQLPGDQEITGFVDANVALTNLEGGQSGVVESEAPIAIPAAGGQWTPISLDLTDAGDAFIPESPLVAVTIPKDLGEGVAISRIGLSVAPVEASGQSVSGSQGVRDDATIFYANTQLDVDTLVKPTTFGFSIDATLRSVDSPQELAYKVALPAGATIVQAEGDGPLEVVKEGVTIATVPVPVARDAEGTVVPVGMSIVGDTIQLTIDHRVGNYKYPIEVDPEFDEVAENFATGNWHASNTNGFKYETKAAELRLTHEGAFPANNAGFFSMQTKGDSSIYAVSFNDSLFPFYLSSEVGYQPSTYPYQSAWVEIVKPGGEKYVSFLQGKPYLTSSHVCANAGCLPQAGGENNELAFATSTTESSAEAESRYNDHEFTYGGSLSGVVADISLPKGEHAKAIYNTSSLQVDGTPNVLHGATGWLGPESGAFEFTAEDPKGLGVAGTKLEYENAGSWQLLHSRNYLAESACIGVQCLSTEPEAFTYNGGLSSLPNGEDKIRVAADDAEPHTWSSEYESGQTTLKVDKTPPHGLAALGLPVVSEELQLGENQTQVKVEAADGETGTKSSGVRSIELYADGRQTGAAVGSCTPGPCTGTGVIELNGAALGSGQHTLVVKATDNAGNIATREYQLSVYHASPVAMGPGSVNPESGDFALGATDVNLSGGSGDLSVSRHYDSLNVTEGHEGPLGPQWAIGLASLASLEVLPDKSVMVIGPEGLSHFAVKSGGGFEPPSGDSNLTLELKESEYLLKNTAKGTTTRFTLPAGAHSWVPTVSEGPVATDTMTETYETVEPEAGKKIVRPTLELAAHPSATCSHAQLEKLEIAAKGCRALEFKYGTETSAKGENESEWKDYKYRLKEVIAVAYNPTTKAMAATPVAQYLYDLKGRLRAEWDPRISPALKTLYGYDSEGHITSIEPAGQQPWVLTYGTISGDPSTGRLIKTMRPPASASLWSGAVVKNQTAPILSGSPVVGIRMAISTGTWANGPSAYAYQWQDCNASGGECKPILGGTNANYTPTISDVGHTLIGRVTATNGGGSEGVTTAASAVVLGTATTTYSTTIGTPGGEVGDLEGPLSIARTSAGEIWLGEGCFCGNQPRGRIQTFNSAGGWQRAFDVNYFGEGGTAAEVAWGSTLDSHNDLWVSDGEKSSVDEFNATGEALTHFGTAGSGAGQLDHPRGIAIDSHHDLWVTDTGNNRLVEFSETGAFIRAIGFGVANGEAKFQICTASCHAGIAGTGSGEFNHPAAITVGPSGTVWAVDTGNNRLEAFTETGGYLRQAGATGSNNGQFSAPSGIAVDAKGTVWVVDNGNHRVQQLNETGEYLGQFGSSGEGANQFQSASAISLDATGHAFITDSTARVIREWTAATTTQGEAHAPEPGSTVEYNIPLQGAGAPQQMGLNTETGKPEPEKWGQIDDPMYAAAIYPPDEPQSWPATDHRRATVFYIDGEARTVNTASPVGGVTTSEYDEDNDVVRSLSADNRALALKEGAKSAELAQLLDTKNKYSADGTELEESRGPQHLVKLPSGVEVNARNHVKYHYDQGAPGGEVFGLVTEVTDGAEYEGKEADVRTTKTSYSGQSNLGWKLREPTSVTTDPSGLNLTTTTVYDENTKKESTGKVVETRTPAAAGKDAAVAPAYSSKFGSSGKGEGQFTSLIGLATDATGNVWVDDNGGDRVEKFSASGTFTAAYGSKGTGGGQFNGPWGIAINRTTGNVYISDIEDNRVEELSAAGTFLRTWGFGVTDGKAEFEVCTTSCKAGIAGAGNGEFNGPAGMGIDATGDVWTVDSGNNRAEEFSAEGTFIKAFGSKGTGKGQFVEPNAIAFSGEHIYVNDFGNFRVEKFSLTGTYEAEFGTKGTGNGQIGGAYQLATDPTSGDLYLTDALNHRVEVFTANGAFVAKFGSEGTGNGQFKYDLGIAASASGIYVGDNLNERVEKWVPAITGSEGARETKTIYYTAKGEAEVAACREHPEWVELPCETKPVAQPGTAGLPELPVSTLTYNMWDEPETATELYGSTTRTKTSSFDSAGRPLTTEETSTAGTSLPKVTDKYNEQNGLLLTQSTTTEGKTKTITSATNSLGQLTAYTDAAGATTSYEYEAGQDGRLRKTSYVAGAEGFSQTYEYNAVSGEMIEMVDAATGLDPAAGRFTANYDVGGVMESESYPNGMTANYAHNATGEATGLEYVKSTDCTEEAGKCKWFKDTVVPSVHGEVASQASTLAQESYAYDASGRLTETQETPVGQNCTTNIYGYDEESNRLSLATRESTTAKCTSENATTQWHSYDTANRLTDPGVTYDAFGNTTKMPAADAGGNEITSSYYVDNQVAKQTQSEKTIAYTYDPAGRTLETTSGSVSTVSHYAGSGSALIWSAEEGGKSWTREIPGIDGRLDAIQTSTGAPVLQLHDLKGDIVATVGISETETKLLSQYNSTEFGVPNGKVAPPRYSWLGADGVASELSSGTVTQDGLTYVPQTGLPLQTQGAAPPIPSNASRAFVSPTPQSIEGDVAGTSALATFNEGQARKALEAADAPQCNEEVEGCGPDPEHGTNSAFCTVWVSWSHYFNNRLGVNGHSFCVKPEILSVQIALLERQSDGSYKVYAKTQTTYHNAEEDEWHDLKHTWICEEGRSYQAWVWGGYKYAGGPFVWTATAEDGHEETCAGLVREDPTSDGADTGSYK
jgi:YD repeat-containing protein